MMPTDRFDRQLPALLTELAEPRTPDYLDDLLWQTANTSQRPAWSFLERWLPMFEIARQPVMAPRIPWRTIGLGLTLLGLLIAMAVALAVGTRPNPPAPFGPARSGLVAYAADGDIFTVDPVTGVSTAVMTGPETDLNPRWSLDGTRLAFERKEPDGRGPGNVYVSKADGSDLVRITPVPLPAIESYAFSPNGRDVLISAWPDQVPGILIAAADGSGIRQLEMPGAATNAAWRPPDGSEILFMDRGNYTEGFGSMYAIDVASGDVRTILEDDPARHRAHALWSPDGSQVAYAEWVDSGDLTAQIHVIAADGTGDRVLPTPPDAIWQVPFSWSNDGTRLLALRGYTGQYEESVAVALPVDASGSGVEFDTTGAIGMACCTAWAWAPDDSSILGTPTDVGGTPLDQVLLDPLTRSITPVPWNSASQPTWQRLAR